MSEKKNNILLIFILFFISASLAVAFIIQYGLGHAPCKLCLYERIPYIVSILLIIKIILFTKYKKITLLMLALIFMASTILSFYHFGIEQGFFNELNVCESDNLSGKLTKEDLLEELNKTNISCKDVSFRIMGLSLASINTIFSFTLSYIFIKLFSNYGKN
jgi:disulfide bond formation protein DsbB